MGQFNILQLLPRFHLFSALDPEELSYVANETQYLAVPRGVIVFNRGDTASNLYMLISGQIKLAVNSPQGTEKVVCIIGPGCVSSGEGFAKMLAALPHVTLVGEPTRGSSGSAHRREIHRTRAETGSPPCAR